MVKSSQFKDPTIYNARTAQANVGAQNQVHSQSLLKNSAEAVKQAQIEASQPGYTPIVNSYTDPYTGVTTVQKQKTFGGITSDPDALNRIKATAADSTGSLQAAKTVYGARGAGTTATSNQKAGEAFDYGKSGSVVTQTLAPSTGAIQDAERARLKASGMNDSQIALQEAKMQPEIQRTMSNTGLPSTDRQNKVVTPKTNLQVKLDSIDAKYKSMLEAGSPIDPVALQSEKMTAIEEDKAINEKAALDKKVAIDKQAADINASQESEVIHTPNAKTTGVNSAIEAGLAKVSPELAAAFRQQQAENQLAQDRLKTSIEIQQDNLDTANKTAMDSIEELKQGFKEGNDMIKGLIEESSKANEETLANQEKAARERAAWTANQNERRVSAEKAKAHESMVAQIALSGGFAQDAGLAAVRESDAAFEARIDDIRTELGVENTEISAKYSALYLANKNDYINKSIANVKEGLSDLERLTMQGNTQTLAYKTASNAILDKTWSAETALRSEQAKNNMDAIRDMNILVKESKQEKIDKEDRALKQITKLLNDFPEGEVRGMVLELGKDVTSFSVESMLNAKSKEEIKSAQAAAIAKQNAINMQLLQKQKNAPIVTKDEFIKNKIAEKEQALGMTMNEKMRNDYLKSNQAYFDSQFDQFTSPNFQNMTSGDPNVDAATDAFMRGDFTSIKEAAKTYNVSPSDVSTYAGILRSEGGKVGDIRALQPEQAKELTVLRKAIDDNDVTKKLNVMDTAIPKIGVARSSLTGVGDVALLNFYQNGIVDPGLAVRKEDADILRKASAIKDKITTQYAEEILLKGAFFPDQTRAEMERIANQVYEATQRVYKEKVYTPIVEQGKMSGINEPYFKYKQHVPSSNNTTAELADTYTSSFAY